MSGGWVTGWNSKEAAVRRYNPPTSVPSASVATLPIVVLYVFFQRYFVEGIAASGVKG
jgi:ABC-type glycerol-3-phosphate transport system permease component